MPARGYTAKKKLSLSARTALPMPAQSRRVISSPSPLSIDVLVGMETICPFYESRPGIHAVEWFQFDAAGKVVKAMAHYAHAMR